MSYSMKVGLRLNKEQKYYCELRLFKTRFVFNALKYWCWDLRNYGNNTSESLGIEIKNGNKQAILTKILFDAQKGINAIDRLSNKIHLAKGIENKMGIGVYPEDLKKEEFHQILIKMLKEKKIEEVKNILNQRSIVVRDGEYLKSIDYIDYFKEDFAKMADLLEISRRAVAKQIAQLQARGVIRRVGPDKGGHWELVE